MYKVYCVDAKSGYLGYSLVAADNAEKANKVIDSFKKFDEYNCLDSWGYSHVDESDVIDGLWAEHEGITYQGIIYHG